MLQVILCTEHVPENVLVKQSVAYKGAWRDMEDRALLLSEAWLCDVGSLSSWLLPYASLQKAQFYPFSLEDQSKCQAYCLCSSLGTWRGNSPCSSAFLPSMRVCLRSELSSSGISLTFHLEFELVQSLPFSILPLAPTCWDGDTSAQTYISLAPLTSPWQTGFLTAFTMSNSSVEDLTSWKLYSLHQIATLNLFTSLSLQAPLFRHWQEGDSALYCARDDASQWKFIGCAPNCLLRLTYGQRLFLNTSH